MQQEDDWDRDLLLDPAWEKQQRKVTLTLRSIISSLHPFKVQRELANQQERKHECGYGPSHSVKQVLHCDA